MNVRVFLRTPLHRGRVRPGRKYELEHTVIEIVGVATAQSAGLDIQISSLFTDKGEEVASPWPHLFLPNSKIDSYVIE